MLVRGLRLSTRVTKGPFRIRTVNSYAFTKIPTPYGRQSPSRFCQRTYSTISTEGEEISDKIDDISAFEYDKIANEYLETIGDELEDLSADYPQVDCELSHGVMTLVLPPYGTYVINKQPPNKQIWLSSPLSGPNRYDLIGGKWITLRDNSSLTDLLESEISLALENEFKFEQVEN